MNHYSSRTLLAFGTGLAIGSSLSAVVCFRAINRLVRKFSRISTQITDIKTDIKQLKDQLHIQEYKEVTSPSDDDDRFVEAGDFFIYDSNNQNLVDTRKFFTEIDENLEGSSQAKEEAYQCLLKYKNEYSSNVDYLWRLAKACYTMSNIEAERFHEENKKKLLYACKAYAHAALELDPCSSNTHKWCAISLGVVGEYEGIQKKIANGFKIKEHIDQSINLNKHDYSTQYMLGRWCYEVYMLSWIERKIASALFTTPPTSTIDDALSAFFECEKLNPRGYKSNMLYIAKCYIQKHDFVEALKWLKHAHELTIKTSEDHSSHDEIIKLTSKYSGH